MVWPMLAGLFGSLFGAGAAGAGAGAAGVATAAGGASGGGALGGLLGGGSGAAGALGTGAESALSGIMGNTQAGPMSMMGGAGPQSVASGVPTGTSGSLAAGGPLDDPNNWQKFLSSVEGDMEKPMSQEQKATLAGHLKGGGVADASRPQYGVEDFRGLFGKRDRSGREMQKAVGLMHPQIQSLLGG